MSWNEDDVRRRAQSACTSDVRARTASESCDPARRASSLLVRVLLGGALAVVAASAIQCRSVEDVTGVDSSTRTVSARPGVCTRACNARYRADRRAEQFRHRNAVHACSHDRACVGAEAAEHRQRERALAKSLRACRSTCYNEGAGSGGR